MKLFLLLLALWVILNESLAPADLLLGMALAAVGVAAFARLRSVPTPLRRPAVAAQLLAAFIADMVRSNIAVARIVLGIGTARRTAGFLTMPLVLRHPAGLAIMACIITSTPGTSWVRYERAENRLTIHVLDLVDEAAWIHLFKERYERRLMEIFE